MDAHVLAAFALWANEGLDVTDQYAQLRLLARRAPSAKSKREETVYNRGRHDTNKLRCYNLTRFGVFAFDLDSPVAGPKHCSQISQLPQRDARHAQARYGQL